jgi:hypothetical protein
MKTIRLTAFLALFFGLTLASHAADHAAVQGILISASNEPGQTDRRLAQYEPTLRKILRFESFKFLGDDNTGVDVPASGSLSIGDGHELILTTERFDGKSLHLKVRWIAGNRTLMNTGLVLRPGVPAVLGGPATGSRGEVYAVILIGR